MWYLVLLLPLCLCAAPPGDPWRCPQVSSPPLVSCSCDLPHTLRCSGGADALRLVGLALRPLAPTHAVSLLDCTVQNVTHLHASVLDGVALHGLVVSSVFSLMLLPPLCLCAAPPGDPWRCPQVSSPPLVSCSCDLPHTLRCSGGADALRLVGLALRPLAPTHAVSLLDCTVQNVTHLHASVLDGVALHGLVVSSGEIRNISKKAFAGLAGPLQALGLPNNQLTSVPIQALSVISTLDRLDLSHNRLKALDPESFKGLFNLTFLDLSDNILSVVTPNAFTTLLQIRTLRLRGNKLTMATVAKLVPFETLEELDLSSNSLIGPVGPNTLPEMQQLRDLQLAHNSLSSIRRGALEGLQNLTSLILHHNQIDVLEDHAFSQLSSLVHLDLAHNRIVAVSGASLAHLTNLTELDLRHNFLRALTADLILPLTSLKDLRLDDNDISIIATDALRPETVLDRLTLSDNPLNCDCSLIDFAVWLTNSSVTKEDRSTAVCTTPPSLENGLLVDVPTTDLLCGEDEKEDLVAPVVEPVAKSQVTLKDFKYDGITVSLQWEVDAKAVPYTCDAIFVYEEEGANEVLLESNPLKCNSSELKDPLSLNVTVPSAADLQLGHRYRYCVVLLESGQSDELSLVLGCSEVIPLIPNVKLRPKNKDIKEAVPRITNVQANLTTYGSLSMQVALFPSKDCTLNVAILQQGTVLSQRRINCSEPKYVFVGMHDGPYRVCANVVPPGPNIQTGPRPRCVTAIRREPRGLSGLDVVLVAVFLVLCFMLVAVVWGVRRILLKPKIQTHQCFMAPDETDEQQHSRYVKLQATTKL